MEYVWKNISCTIGIILQVLAVQRRGLDCQVLVAPANTVGLLGNRTVFYCQIEQIVQQWLEEYSARPVRTISTNENIHPDYEDRYSIEGQPKEYSLIILQAQYAEAGTHVCIDSVAITDRFKWAELIMLDSNPTCYTNSSDVGNILIDGEYVGYTCSVRYVGLWGPKMIWTTNTGTTINAYDDSDDTLTPKLVQYSYTSMVTASINQQSIRVLTAFDPPASTPDNAASNAPDYQHVWSSPSITVHYPPRDVVFQHCTDSGCNIIDNNEFVTIHPGDRIHASAVANPSIDYYVWKNCTNIFQEGSDLNEYTFLNTGFSTIECIVRNTMRGGVQETASRIILVISVIPETTTITIQSSEGSVSTSTQSNPCEQCKLYNGLDSGSIAGIAICSFLIGAVIPTILLVIVYRNQKKHRGSNQSTNASSMFTNPASNPDTPEAMSTGTINRGAYEDLNLSPYFNTREARPENNVYQDINREDTPYE